jgi:hypothetical protein
MAAVRTNFASQPQEDEMDFRIDRTRRSQPRPWADIERNMERARDLRAATCAALARAAFRGLLRRLGRPLLRAAPAMRNAAALGCAIAIGVAAMPDMAAAQEAREARLDRPADDGDRARLGALGIDAAAIEQCEDVPALWRAVRELVLPGRLSEGMQQRVLRRVWIADREISDAPASGSDAN